MSQVSLAIIGCGGMTGTHAKGLTELGDILQVKATVDIVKERAEKAAEFFPGAKAATDYRDVLDDVEAVLIVLPHHLHHPVAKECLEAGKHVLLEKPMANTEEECLDLIETSTRVQRVLMIAYCMRFHPLVVRMKQLIDERAFGDLFQMSIWTEQLTQYPADHWRNIYPTGGGQFFSHGCHYIDLMLWILGKPIVGTHLGTNFGTPWIKREGTSNVAIEFEGGKIGYHFGTWGARGSRLRNSFHAHCTEGMLEIDPGRRQLILHKGGKEMVLMETQPGKHTQNEMIHFIECINTGRRPLTDGPSSLQGLRVIWRLYEAEQNNVMADLRDLSLDNIKL
ncbi:MAG: Gfo/Idh/MocA family oxidoreductase [Firmicutes bacterium]|jgi:predicted dehydrogenase|nr:Gfo/Idh/MocA family oxidoreductase [Bacillota bacterium]